jgi:DUF2933 family protein
MNDGMHKSDDRNGDAGKWRFRFVFFAFLAIAAFFLILEHRAHLSGVLSYLPFLLLLACPFLHIFGHGSHGGHGGRRRESGTDDGEHGHH